MAVGSADGGDASFGGHAVRAAVRHADPLDSLRNGCSLPSARLQVRFLGTTLYPSRDNGQEGQLATGYILE